MNLNFCAAVLRIKRLCCNLNLKSAYALQLEGKIKSPVASAIWKPWGPNKCKFFLWLLLQNRIWTADRLLLREWPNSYFCPLCRRNLETAFHMVAECTYSKQVWNATAVWAYCTSLSPDNWNEGNDLQTWFKLLTAGQTQQRGLQTLVLLVIWSLWRERNRRIFQLEELPPSRFISFLRDDVRTWVLAGAKHLDSLVAHIFEE